MLWLGIQVVSFVVSTVVKMSLFLADIIPLEENSVIAELESSLFDRCHTTKCISVKTH